MPPGKLDVTVLKAANLKNTQTFGNSCSLVVSSSEGGCNAGRQDPFFVVQVGDQHFTSEVAHDAGRNPAWNARYSFQTRNEDKIYFTIRNRNVITTDSHLGDATIDLHTVYTQGKHDAIVQVITGAGKVQGELSVILLFTSYETEKKSKDKSGMSSGVTPGGQTGVPLQPTGYAVNPGAPMNPMPSAPPAPVVNPPYVPQQQPVPAQYPAAGGYPPPQMNYPPPNPPVQYPASTQGGPVPYNIPGVVPQPTMYSPPPGYPPSHHGQQGYPGGHSPPLSPAPIGGFPPSGYPQQQGGYFGPGVGTYGTAKGHGKVKHGKKGKKKK